MLAGGALQCMMPKVDDPAVIIGSAVHCSRLCVCMAHERRRGGGLSRARRPASFPSRTKEPSPRYSQIDHTPHSGGHGALHCIASMQERAFGPRAPRFAMMALNAYADGSQPIAYRLSLTLSQTFRPARHFLAERYCSQLFQRERTNAYRSSAIIDIHFDALVEGRTDLASKVQVTSYVDVHARTCN
jgi:hypothetical protein